MRISYGRSWGLKAEKDCAEVYEIAEKRLGSGIYKWNREELRNAFQVLRYAMREWAEDKPRGVVWRMLMSGKDAGKEVRSNSTEMVIQCEDEDIGIAIGRLLKEDGYEEEICSEAKEFKRQVKVRPEERGVKTSDAEDEE